MTRPQERQLAILKLLASDPDGLTNADIAAKLGLSYRDVERNTCELHRRNKLRKNGLGAHDRILWCSKVRRRS